MKVTILGGGSFGTAVANIVAENEPNTCLWMRDADQVASVTEAGENARYLPGYPLNADLEITADLTAALQDSNVVFVSVPSASFREVCETATKHIATGSYVISTTKGIEKDSFKLMSQILDETCSQAITGVISGPNLALEVAAGHYTGTVVASKNRALCESIQALLKSPTFRVYANSDVYGVELAGALKNIYAIVCGMAAGLEVGQNTIGMLITRSLAEMSRFAVSMGANPLTFLGLAGVGDLLVTCSSPLSRNYQLGAQLAQGKGLEEAITEMGKLAEGVNTLAAVYQKSHQLDVYMPLVEGLHSIVFGGENIAQVIRGLMTADQGVDVEFAQPS